MDVVFWTEEMPASGIDVNLARGSATMQASDMFVLDHHDLGNAIGGGGPSPLPGTTSFRVQWRGVDQRLNLAVDDPKRGRYAGEIVRNSAQMQWSALVDEVSFVSDPMATSVSSFAEIGQVRNGMFLT